MAWTWTGHFKSRLDAVADLIAGKTDIGFKKIWKAKVESPPTYPCICLQASSEGLDFTTTDYYHVTYQIAVYFYAKGSKEESVDVNILNLGAALTKLFSNNAEGDLGTTHSGRYKQHGANWFDCEMGTIEYFTRKEGDKLTRLGLFTLTLYSKIQM